MTPEPVASLLGDLLAVARAGRDLKRKYTKLKSEPDARFFTYVLKLRTNGMLYVGSTDNIYARLLQHATLDGTAQVVRAFGPVERLVRVYSDCGPNDEKLVTIELMSEFGHSHVRGGPFCRVDALPAEPVEVRGYRGGCVVGRRMTRAEIDAIMDEVDVLAAPEVGGEDVV